MRLLSKVSQDMRASMKSERKLQIFMDSICSQLTRLCDMILPEQIFFKHRMFQNNQQIEPESCIKIWDNKIVVTRLRNPITLNSTSSTCHKMYCNLILNYWSPITSVISHVYVHRLQRLLCASNEELMAELCVCVGV